ncbi:MAG TPA: STN and carboxypeptidase regulatory-like domain-containing protein, partial [Longimicrobiales bacterium]|nr:STN and carboxypeptidase regulatory-like domain-containing protein [Longimicrobiales bacterium]
MTRVLLSMMAVALLTAPLSVAAQATFNSPDPRARQETTRRPLVTLDLNRSPLGDVLREIADRVDVRLVYGNDVVPVERRVSVQLRQASLEEALEEALRGTDIAFEFTGSRQVILMQRPEAAPSKPAAAAVGAIRGRVTDAETDHPIGMADIWIEGSNWSTTTNRRGQYLIMGVTVGRHTVSAGRIGYDRRSREITV